MKILFHYNDYAINPERKKANKYGGVGYYRIIKVAQQVKDHEVTIMGREFEELGNTLEERLDSIFKEYDVIWMPYFYQAYTASALFYYRDKYKKKVIIDLDDNYLDVPESNYLYDQFKKTKKDRAFLSTILSFADAVTVSTEPLKSKIFEHIKRVHGIEKPIYVIPNYNDVNDWNFTQEPRTDEKIVIGYAGSTSHNDDFSLILPHVVSVMEKYPNVWFEIMGVLTKDSHKNFVRGVSKDVLQRMGGVGATHYFNQYPGILPKRQWDIGIAPLVDTAFTRSKSHIKWMEYSMYKIPTIASRVYPYFMELNGRETIEDGVTGMLCKPQEWADKLEKLVVDADLRKRIGENAYNFVIAKWQYKDSDINEVVNTILNNG